MFRTSLLGSSAGEEKADATLLPRRNRDRAIANIQAAIDALGHPGAVDVHRGGASHAALRAATGRLGLLSLTALTFATINRAQAADADVTFLDEDSISYKDMAHGAFELVTKEPVPRYLLVEDPGETIVLNRTGSSISVSQLANSPARMEELQTAQREVHANLAHGFDVNGSGTPFFGDPASLLQPINFIQPGGPAAQEALPVLPTMQTTTEFVFARAPDPPPPTLTLALGTGPTEIDTVVFDTFEATSGSFSASSSSGGALTYGISGGTPGNTVISGTIYDVSQVGDYGTLYVSSGTGAYTFVPDDAAINALKAPTTQDFVVTVSDGTISASQTFAIDIDGVNDHAVIDGNVTGSLDETGSAAGGAGVARFALTHAPAPAGPRTATGTLSSADVDDTPNAFTAVTSPAASDGGYGSFTMTADGVWSYTLDDGNGAVQALNVGDRLTDTFTVTTIDGTEQVVTIVIGGRNDPAAISGDTEGSVVEAACKNPGVPAATGTLTSTDVDNASSIFTPVKCQKSDGGYGTFTMTADGEWTYTLDNDHCKVQSLDDCDTLTDTFTVTSEDGTEQVITITIQGADDGHHHHHHHHHHHKHPHKTSASSEVEAALVSDAAAGERSASIAATDVQPNDALANEVPKNEAHTSAVTEISFAAEPGTAGSFQFAEQSTGSPALDALILGDVSCIQTLITSFANAQDASDIAEAIQAFQSCLVQCLSDFFNAISNSEPVTSQASHDLIV